MRVISTLLTACILMMVHWDIQAKTTNSHKASSTENADESSSFVYTKSYFSQMTYKWKDDKGVEHTSNLTETASGWNQMKAFINKIMTDRNVPGVITDPTPTHLRPTNGRRFSKEDTEFDPDVIASVDYYTKGYSEWGIKYKNEKTPYEDSPTAIIVGLKPEYNSKQDASSKTTAQELVTNWVEDMKLMTHRIRVEGDNPGWIFNARFPLNKFFIMTKGKLRTSSDKPFAWMFEQFSPAEDYFIPTDVYDQMLREREFNVLHDCRGVITKYHPTIMGRTDESSEYVSSVFIFIPDSRFGAITEEDITEDERSGEDENGKYRINDQYKNTKVYIGEDWSRDLNTSFIYYKPSATPFMFFNTARLSVVEVKESNATDGKCSVILDWHTHLGTMLTGTDFYEKYHLYRVVDGKKELIADINKYSNPNADSQVAIDDNGRVRIVHNDKNDRSVQITITEDQELYAREVEYVVESAVLDMEISYIDSNVASAIIPGLSPLERCELVLVGYPESTFNYLNDADGNEADYNHYTHKFKLVNRRSQNYPLLAEHLKQQTTQEGRPYIQLIRALSRADVIEGDPDKCEFLDKIVITGYDEHEDGYTYFKAKMPGEDEEVVLFRSLTSGGDTAIVELIKGTNFVWFTSVFNVATKDNLHPDKYLYRLATNIPIYDTLNDKWDYARSSPVRIEIPHTSVSSSLTGYELDDIINDKNHALDLSQRAVNYDVVKHIDIETYEVLYNGRKLLAQTRQSQDEAFYQTLYTGAIDCEDEENDSTIEEVEPGIQEFEIEPNLHKNNGNLVCVITDFDGNTYGTGRAIVSDDIEIDGDIRSIKKTSDAGNEYVIAADWTPSNTANNQTYTTANRYYNAWMAFDDTPENVNIYSQDFWDYHSYKKQVKDVSERAKSKSTYDSSTGDNINYTYIPDWNVGRVRLNNEYPLVVSLLVRYYPLLNNTNSTTPLYGVFESRYSAAGYGDGDPVTNIDGPIGADSHLIEVYSLQGIKLVSYVTNHKPNDSLDGLGLSSGTYIVKIDKKRYKMHVRNK